MLFSLLFGLSGLRALLEPPRTGLGSGDPHSKAIRRCCLPLHTPIRTNQSAAMHTNKQLALLSLLAVASALCMAAGDAAASAITQAKEQPADQVRLAATTSTGPARCYLYSLCSLNMRSECHAPAHNRLPVPSAAADRRCARPLFFSRCSVGVAGGCADRCEFRFVGPARNGKGGRLDHRVLCAGQRHQRQELGWK